MLSESELLKIDTRQGTDNQHAYSNGNCLPYTGVPFGMNHFAVQTSDQRGSWYFNPHDRVFQGYRLTHQPSPWMGDFSAMTFQPVSGMINKPDIYHVQSTYRTEEAVFAPHYNQLKQERYQITSELVPTTYGAIIRSQYKDKEKPALFIRSQGKYQLIIEPNEKQLSGYVINYAGAEDTEFKMYFSVSFSESLNLKETRLFNAEPLVSGKVFTGEDLQLLVRFTSNALVETTLATSFLTIEQAKLNLARVSEKSFATLKTEASQQWLNYLNRIEVTDNNTTAMATFYASLYRTALFPQKFYEVNAAGVEQHYDTLSKTIKPGKLYTNNGFWDTYKTVYPLYSLIAQEEYRDMLEGFLNSYRNAGYLPKWLSPDERGLMPGTLIDAVVADAAVKKIAPQLMTEFLAAMLKGATSQSDNPHYGRRGTNQYNQLGYVSSEFGESVNHTQDYAYSDFCIAQVAASQGQSELAANYWERSHNYRHLFDKKTGFMRAKTAAGQFVSDFDPLNWGKDYTEGSAWQNSFATYHDFADLINLHGGEASFLEKLITLCNTTPEFNVFGYGAEIHEMSEMAAVNFGQVAMSNQPSFHLPYLFNYINQPMYTQLLVKNIKDNLFDASWQGFPGDEDNGSMAAWYIFSSLGFYPVTPGVGEYVVGIPSFAEVKLHLANGKTLTIEATGDTVTHQFVGGVTQGGQTINPLSLSHEQLMSGEALEFIMTLVPPRPLEDEAILPYSLSQNSR